MEYVWRSKISTKVSLVVSPIDDYTAERRSGGNINVFLNELPQRPVRKNDGYYIFTNLTEGTYTLCLRSDIYLDENITVSLSCLNQQNPIVYPTLKPSPNYFFTEGSTLVRASVRDTEGNAMSFVIVKAVVLSHDCARARLAQDGAKKGSRQIYVFNMAGKISVGDKYLIKGKEDIGSEVCQIAGTSDETHCFNLNDDLQFDHCRGELLLPVIHTRTDDRGEVVIYFRNARSKYFDVKMEFNCNHKSIEKSVRLEEGKTTNLGLVRL